MRSKRFLPLCACVLLLAVLLPAGLSAESFADAAFERVWQRSDRPVAAGRVSRSWLWGPEPFTGPIWEPYAESPGGTRLVQYFDKSRMEINDPGADPNSAWFVTNGLLVREMVDGHIVTGANSFIQASPSQEAVVGDAAPNNPNCPTYAAFQYLSWQRAENRVGQAVTTVMARDGTTWDDPAKAGYPGTTVAYYEATLGHNVPRVFWDFMNQVGLVYENGTYRRGKVFDWLYTMGYPITEPYWVRAAVGGVEQDVMVQLFERRVLSYTPANPIGWQVEMGNVGLHYYTWRYGGGGTSIQPGLYTFENLCTWIVLIEGRVSVRWCVESVEVRTDGYMKVNVTWQAILPSTAPIVKYSDVGNTNMYLVDNLGNRYDHVEVGDAAAHDVRIYAYETVRGWFLFPPARAGATTFTFYDDDQHVRIEGIVLRR